jgi:carboxypeptidase C (cathepsin A)
VLDVSFSHTRSSLFVLQVHDVGHMVPMDQLEAALEMLTKWLGGPLTQKKTAKDMILADM